MLINLRKRSLKSDERQPSPRCSQAARARLWPLLHHSQGLTAPPQATISAISQAFGAISQARICPCLLLTELEAFKEAGYRIFRETALIFAERARAAHSGTPSAVVLQNLVCVYQTTLRAERAAAVVRAVLRGLVKPPGIKRGPGVVGGGSGTGRGTRARRVASRTLRLIFSW